MNYQELMKVARGEMGKFCKACPVCDGRACANSIPGPGSKPPGNIAFRNYQKWQELCINMDTIYQDSEIQTDIEIFGKKLSIPVLAAPISGMHIHYSGKYGDMEYSQVLVDGCSSAGIAAFVGDTADPRVFEDIVKGIVKEDGAVIPTIKPWGRDAIFERIDASKRANVFAFSMDIDAAGLPFLKQYNRDAGSKTVEELKEIIEYAELPFVIKGIMTVKGAIKAIEAGAAGIIVSNHGGRVQGGLPSTCEVLPEIVKAAKGKTKIFVDGGIRTGLDIFRALALGADAVLIGRPFVPVIFGSGKAGIIDYVAQLKSELRDTMAMCGATSISDIDESFIWGGSLK